MVKKSKYIKWTRTTIKSLKSKKNIILEPEPINLMELKKFTQKNGARLKAPT